MDGFKRGFPAGYKPTAAASTNAGPEAKNAFDRSTPARENIRQQKGDSNASRHWPVNASPRQYLRAEQRRNFDRRPGVARHGVKVPLAGPSSLHCSFVVPSGILASSLHHPGTILALSWHVRGCRGRKYGGLTWGSVPARAKRKPPGPGSARASALAYAVLPPGFSLRVCGHRLTYPELLAIAHELAPRSVSGSRRGRR